MPLASELVRRNPLRIAFGRCRRHFAAAASFSAASNILLLTPSIYMMQVYDRVLPTGGFVTLAAISAVAVFGLATLSALDWLRTRILMRAGARLDHELARPILHLIMSKPSLSRLTRAEAMRDLDTLRHGVSSHAASALFDAPWTPIYIVTAFLLHPALGALALGSAILMLVLAWDNERRIRLPLSASSRAGNAAYARQLHITSHAAEVRALGLATALTDRQLLERAEVNSLQIEAGLVGGNHSSLVKFFRLTLQSGALALGAVLVVDGRISAGAMFAGSLLLSRALQPIEQIVGSWKSLLQSRNAYVKLGELLGGDTRREHTQLPAPTGAIAVERLTVLAPISDRISLAEVSFAVAPGEIVGIVGQSGSGKSTLLRALAGAAFAARGNVRFDGASSADWDPEQLAQHVGYVPQTFVLFPGTVKENISRFRGARGEVSETLDAAVIAAAKAIGAHEMILRLTDGYDTVIGSGGIGLSAGQTQSIAIARALFEKPKILLLDEATAHLDPQGQHAFQKLLSSMRAEGTTVLFATHSGDLLASADKLLLLKEGRIERFGPLADTAPVLRPVSHVPQKVPS